MLQPHENHFAEYEILRELAQGMYCTVYKARHTHPKLCDRLIALKLLRHRGYAEYFLREARTTAFLDHPRIPSLCQVGEMAGQVFMVRKFVEGDDLQNDIGGARRNLPEVVRIVTEIASALDYAHGRGIVHGFVHPRHVLLETDSSVWLIGFGEAFYSESAALGNPVHFAPEQLEAGGTVTSASDVYTLSETALWLLCGQHPFGGFRSDELLAAKRTGCPHKQIRKLLTGLPSNVEQALQRGMAPDSGQRYATAGEFAAALASSVEPVKQPRRWWSWW